MRSRLKQTLDKGAFGGCLMDPNLQQEVRTGNGCGWVEIICALDEVLAC